MEQEQPMDQEQPMNPVDPRPIPDALSHRQLTALLQAAALEQPPVVSDTPPLTMELAEWSRQTQLLLQQMAQEGESIGTSRSDQQVMALGSFRTHLLLGLQALREAQH